MARRGRKPCCEKVGLNKGSWTPEEDLRLIAYINGHGHGNWRALPKLAGLLRCGKSCRLRWINYLRPDIKRGNFSGEEEETIIRLHELLGNKWSKIAACLPGRTDNEIKNVWNTHLKKRLIPPALENSQASSSSASPSSSTDGSSLDGLIDLPMELMIDADIWAPPASSQQVSPSSSSSELSAIAAGEEGRREQPPLLDEAELGEDMNDDPAWLEYLEKELGLCPAAGETMNGDGHTEAWDFEITVEELEEDPVTCYFERELNFTSSPIRLT